MVGAAADGREAVRLARELRPDAGLFAQGRTNSEIAGALHIIPSTAKALLASLMKKLGARNRVGVAMWAHETGRV